jgi:DNA-binding transcriptional ArsR family regulator
VSPCVNPALRLVRALDDPLRYAVLVRLLAGPATVSELVASSGAAQPNVSNHLAILREAELVTTSRNGRHVAYALADPSIAAVIEALEHAAGGGAAVARATPEIAVARSCYDHLAGKLGVALFDALVARRALRDVYMRSAARKVRSGLGPVTLGAAADAVFGALGIDLEEVATQKRQFATACSDWTESRPHLGGALGAALQERLLRERWLLRRGGTRVLRITPVGRAQFAARFAIDVDALGSGSGVNCG